MARKEENTILVEYENKNYYLFWWSDKRPFPYNWLGLTVRTDNFVNVNVFNSVTSSRVLFYRSVLY